MMNDLSHSFSIFVVFVFTRVGIEIPTIEVRYEHLNIEAYAYVGGRALPTLLNSITNQVEVNLI
jgi:hypothetical protein